MIHKLVQDKFHPQPVELDIPRHKKPKNDFLKDFTEEHRELFLALFDQNKSLTHPKFNLVHPNNAIQMRNENIRKLDACNSPFPDSALEAKAVSFQLAVMSDELLMEFIFVDPDGHLFVIARNEFYDYRIRDTHLLHGKTVKQFLEMV